MLSKMMKPKLNEKVDLEKCKLPELKVIAKERGLRVSGKKEDLKQRVQENIKHHEYAARIQSVFRGKMTRRWIHLKKMTVAPPVNETDFYTLEPLAGMEFLCYIDYLDEKNNATYVFNINSLINMMAKTGALLNPYTREKMDTKLLYRMIEIIHFTYILFPGSDLINILKSMREMKDAPMNNVNVPALPIDPNKNYSTLANELFMKIDELGNYTNIGWFTNLSNTQLALFVVRMCHFWSKIDRSLRQKICPRRKLFSEENLGIDNMDQVRTIEENRALVIRIGETLVNDGIDAEHKTLGAMYFLTGLTVVSNEVRQQMPWLYDNYFVIARNR
jgi:hypothetical protein